MSNPMTEIRRKVLVRTFLYLNSISVHWHIRFAEEFWIYILRERVLRITYDDYMSDFEELLVKEDTFTIRQHNRRTLAIAMYNLLDI